LEWSTVRAHEIHNGPENHKSAGGEETDDEVIEDEMDVFRQETLDEWDQLGNSYRWRWDWLKMRTKTLENDLKQINQSLESVVPNQDMIGHNIVSLEMYPPQVRSRDIDNHPLFSYTLPIQTDKLSKDQVMQSFKYFTSKYKKRKPVTSTTSTPKKKKKLEPEYIIVPWSDIRPNMKIPEEKTPEIVTPDWRTPTKIRMEAFPEEEDYSDERYMNLHFPLEIEERKRYLTLLTMKKTNFKKKEEEKEILSVFVNHNGEEGEDAIKTPVKEEKSVIKVQQKLEKVNRNWTQVTKESYISEVVSEPAKGNYHSLPVWVKPKEDIVVKKRKRDVSVSSDPIILDTAFDDFIDDEDEDRRDQDFFHEREEPKKRDRRRKKKKGKPKKEYSLVVDPENPMKLVFKAKSE
jgi:hypothetical protein